jgi:protein TonB
MGRASSDRVSRAVSAGAVLLLHAAAVWFLVQPFRSTEGSIISEPVTVAIIEQPRPRNIVFGPISVHVKMAKVPVELERLAPNVQDIPVEEPEPPVAVVSLELAASPALPEQAKSGLDGDSRESSARSGGGDNITLLERVIPPYPVASAQLQEEGTVNLAMRVRENGRVDKVRITRGSGFPRLDDAAVEAFKQWKFAPMPRGSAPAGKWMQTEHNFIVLRLRFSRLSDKAADEVHVEAVQPATDVPTTGSQQALSHFIDEVLAGRSDGALDDTGRRELGKMSTALRNWGALKSITFAGTAGPRGWTAYRIRPGAADEVVGTTVELHWDSFEVRLERATTEWLIAVDRDGTIWSALVGRAGESPVSRPHLVTRAAEGTPE